MGRFHGEPCSRLCIDDLCRGNPHNTLCGGSYCDDCRGLKCDDGSLCDDCREAHDEEFDNACMEDDAELGA